MAAPRVVNMIYSPVTDPNSLPVDPLTGLVAILTTVSEAQLGSVAGELSGVSRQEAANRIDRGVARRP